MVTEKTETGGGVRPNQAKCLGYLCFHSCSKVTINWATNCKWLLNVRCFEIRSFGLAPWFYIKMKWRILQECIEKCMFSILSKINLFGSWRGRSNDDQHEHRDYQNFNTNVIERDIDEIYSSLATGNTDDNLGFELLLRLNEKTLDKIPL